VSNEQGLRRANEGTCAAPNSWRCADGRLLALRSSVLPTHPNESGRRPNLHLVLPTNASRLGFSVFSLELNGQLPPSCSTFAIRAHIRFLTSAPYGLWEYARPLSTTSSSGQPTLPTPDSSPILLVSRCALSIGDYGSIQRSISRRGV